MASKGILEIVYVNLLRNSVPVSWLSHSENPIHIKRYIEIFYIIIATFYKLEIITGSY